MPSMNFTASRKLMQADYEAEAYDYSLLDIHLQEEMQVPDNPYNIPTGVCGALMSLVASIGLIGNIIAAYIFTRKTMGRASIGVLLTGLAITDALLLLVSAPLFASSAIYVSKPGFGLMMALAYMSSYLYPVASALQTSSVWLMMVTTMERYLAVCRPFLAISVCTRHRAKRTVFGVLAAGAAYNVCRFFEYSPTPLDKENTAVVALPGLLRTNEIYILVYVHWMYFIFIYAIPFLVLSSVNIMVMMTIRQARRDRRLLTHQQRKEHARATMMIVVACAYLVCNSLAFVLNAMELWGASGSQDVEIPQIDLATLGSTAFEKTTTGNHSVETDHLSSLIRQFVTDNHNQGDLGPRMTARRHSNLFYFLIDLNNLLVMIHCSVNFLIYYKFNRRFQAHANALFRCKPAGYQDQPTTQERDQTNSYQLTSSYLLSSAAVVHHRVSIQRS